MDEVQVMTAIQLQSIGDALRNKMVEAAYRILYKIASIWFQCYLKMIYLVADGIILINDALHGALPSKFICRKKLKEPDTTVRTEEVVRGVKKLRRTLLVQIDNCCYGRKFKADNAEAIRRLDKLRDSMKGSEEEFQEALNSVNKMNESFREERKVLFKDVEELGIDEIIEAIKEDRAVANGIEEAERNRVSNISREHNASDMNRCNDIRKNKTSRRKNGVSKNRSNPANVKLEQILTVSSNLVGALDNLNQQVHHFTQVSERMAEMQYELSVGRKLLSEVEADRNKMMWKLATLEKLIKEEEKYLDDFSYESGFEEGEMPASP